MEAIRHVPLLVTYLHEGPAFNLTSFFTKCLSQSAISEESATPTEKSIGVTLRYTFILFYPLWSLHRLGVVS